MTNCSCVVLLLPAFENELGGRGRPNNMSLHLNPVNLCMNNSKLVSVRHCPNGFPNMSVKIVSSRILSSIIQKRLFSSFQRCVLLVPDDRRRCQKCVLFIPDGVLHSSFSMLAKIDKTQPFAYYEILNINFESC